MPSLFIANRATHQEHLHAAIVSLSRRGAEQFASARGRDEDSGMVRNKSLSRSALRRPLLALIVVVALLVVLQTGGCYYMQAVNGQLEVLRKREPIVDVLDDADIPEETRERLSMVLEARRFAVDELLLPDNDSYRTYADLERDFVVWNVFAAPEFSLEPKTWCFPVVGCVAYRGYFSEAAAEKHAARLSEQGLRRSRRRRAGVFDAGPIRRPGPEHDDALVRRGSRLDDCFMSSQHQKLFIKGDTGFNESFATAVAEVGLQRWLNARGQAESPDAPAPPGRIAARPAWRWR